MSTLSRALFERSAFSGEHFSVGLALSEDHFLKGGHLEQSTFSEVCTLGWAEIGSNFLKGW